MKGRMVNYKPYPSYKPSGVEWISEIPDKWVVRKLKIVCRFQYGKSLSENERNDNGVPVYGSNGIVGYHDGAITLEPCIVVGRKGSFGKINYSNIKCFPIDTTFYIDKTTTKEDLRWLYYLLLNLRLDEDNQDSAVPGLNREKAYDNIIPFPPYPEQQAIADFLDRETTRINAIIEKQNRLIELLKEKRSALITQAVTKGLDPNMRMKSSGVEWIGYIPEKWEVKRLRFAVKYNLETLSDNATDPNYEIEYLDIGNVDGDGNILSTENLLFRDAPSRARRIVKNEDTIISTVRTYLKAIAFLENIPDNMIASTGFAVIQPQKDTVPKYLFYFFRSKFFVEQVVMNSKGVSYPAITPSQSPFNLIDIPIILAPYHEQQTIADFLDRETAKIDTLMGKIRKQIDLLNEYKQSLITAAVTGKIDVRDSIYATNP